MQFTQGKNKKLKHLQYQCFSLWGFNKYVQIQYLNTNQTWLNYSSVVEILQMHQSHERRRFVVKHDPKHREGQGSASHLHKLLRRSEAADTQRYEDPAASVTAFRGILGQLLTDLTVDLISERNNSWSLQALLCIRLMISYFHICKLTSGLAEGCRCRWWSAASPGWMWVGPPACCFHGLCIHHRSDASPPTEQEREESTLKTKTWVETRKKIQQIKQRAQGDFSVIF